MSTDAWQIGGTADMPDVDEVSVEPSSDATTIRALGIAAGLEDTGRDDEQITTAWLARDRAGQAVGAVALERSRGRDVVNWLAVDEAYRGRGVGARLVRALEDEARARALPRLWATARAPGFFLANGYREVPDGPEARLLLGDCVTCRQYRHGCEPKAMAKDLDRPAAEGDSGDARVEAGERAADAGEEV